MNGPGRRNGCGGSWYRILLVCYTSRVTTMLAESAQDVPVQGGARE